MAKFQPTLFNVHLINTQENGDTLSQILLISKIRKLNHIIKNNDVLKDFFKNYLSYSYN